MIGQSARPPTTTWCVGGWKGNGEKKKKVEELLFGEDVNQLTPNVTRCFARQVPSTWKRASGWVQRMSGLESERVLDED